MNTFKKLFSITAIVALIGTIMPMYAFGASYSSELNQAYDYAYDNGITTMDSIDNADMYGSLTRVAMAKMMSNYAMDVLGLERDTDMECSFPDVSDDLDAQYDNGVTNACQLGLMGVGVDNFDPYGLVNRAQFGTVLSRAMYGNTYNGADPYYADHLEALNDAGIMNNISNPNMLEVRGYVMLMMQRADEDASVGGCTAEELLACITADDYDDCIAACSDEEEEDDEEVVVERDGELTVEYASTNLSDEIPAKIKRVAMLTFDVEAEDADVSLFDAELKFIGFGDYENLEDLSIYNENNLRVSRERDFNNSSELTLGFNPNIVVKAGWKETFTVVAMLNWTWNELNSTYWVSLIELGSSAEDVDGLPIQGETRKGVSVTNVGKLELGTGSYSTADIVVGEEEVLASFALNNTWDYEDVMLETIVFQVEADDDMFSNLELYANDELVSDDLDLRNDSIVANISYLIEEETDVDFEIRGSVTKIDDDFQFLVEEIEDIYAYGTRYNFNVEISGLEDGCKLWDEFTVSGSEITVFFDRADMDEVKPGTDDVHFGTLTLKSKDTNYLINQLKVEVTNTGFVDDIRLNNVSYDETTTGGYLFEDIDLQAGATIKLKVRVDISDDAEEGDEITVDFDLNVVVIEDLDNDVDNVTDVLSTTDVTAKTITIEDASLDVSRETLNDREVVLGWEGYELAYRARVDAGDAADIEVKTVRFNSDLSSTLTDSGYDIQDIVDNAILTIDGVEYEKTRINHDSIDFTNIDALIDAWTTNAKMTLDIKLKSSDTISGTGSFTLAEVDAEDAADSDEVTVDDVPSAAGPELTFVNAWELTVSFDMDDDSSTVMSMFTEQNKFALAWAEEKVVLAKVKLKADKEDISVENMYLTWTDTNNFSDSIDTLSFVLEDDMETELWSLDHSENADTISIDVEDLDIVIDANSSVYWYLLATFKAVNDDENAVYVGATDWAKLSNLLVSSIEFKGLSSEKFEDELDDNLPDTSAKDVTVVANTIAQVDLNDITAVMSSSSKKKVWELKVETTNQSWNLDSEQDVYKAFLNSIDLVITESSFTGGTYRIETFAGDTGSVTGAALVGDREVDGNATFYIYADTSSATVDTGNTRSDTSVEIRIDNVTEDVTFLSQTGWTDVNYLLPYGIPTDLSDSTNN